MAYDTLSSNPAAPSPPTPATPRAGSEAGLSEDPWWWCAAPPEKTEACRRPLPATVDAVLVGAGFTGLSAARILSLHGRSTLVLDASAPGFGASSRNGGMAGSGLRVPLPTLAARYGRPLAVRLLTESLASVDSLERTIEALGIDCGFRRSGRIAAAWTHRHFDGLKRQAEDINELRPDEAEIVGRDRLIAEEVSSERYQGGVLFRTHGGLHPAELHRGLLRAAREAGAHVQGCTPVRRIEETRAGSSVETPAGVVRAKHVLVATNGYSGALSP